MSSSDTIVLNADSSARGWILSEGRRVPVSRWKVAYLSTDPVGSRRDFGLKLQDGGDAKCMNDRNASCVSAPVLCVNVKEYYRCVVFD